MPIVLSSCGIIKPDFKNKVLALFNKPAESIKLLYITTAIDGERGDKSWVDIIHWLQCRINYLGDNT